MDHLLLPAYFFVIAVYLLTCFVIGRRRRKAVQAAHKHDGCSPHSKAVEPVKEVPQTVGLWKPYGENELRADLNNPALTIDEIMARCKDMDPDLIETVVKSVSSGDRRTERLAWYANMLKSNKVLKVVPPPAPQKTVIAVKGSLELCQMCFHVRKANQGLYRSPFDGRYIVNCKFCRDTGYVTIQRG